MTLSGSRTLVNFGFGAIGAGLFLHEAFESGGFGRLVVAEVVPQTVAALRAAGGHYAVNVARTDRVEVARVGPVEAFDPNDASDREKLVAALAAADEIATAVPSVEFYRGEGEGTIARVLAAGLGRKLETGGPRAVVYAAENNNRAAEILEEAVLAEMPAALRKKLSEHVSFLNTVIGKMSGLAADPAARGLEPVTPAGRRAFLVEEFNRILVSRPGFREGFARGIAVFEEKADLLPFEEAKLYGHNATHALAACVGSYLGVDRIADLRDVPGFMTFLRAAFIEESGAALVKKHAGVDELFTPKGYAAYADDLLERMTNPHLGDTVERVARDLERKLGWDDRLAGTIRVCLEGGVSPLRYSLGAAAAFGLLKPGALDDPRQLEAQASSLWKAADPDAEEVRAVLDALEEGRRVFTLWRAAEMPDLAL
ncbi:MAG: mannitol dehydrogenase family protein, partial [Planctomycetota bacterium]